MQYLLPVEKPGTAGEDYDIYPVHDLAGGKIHCDYASLARKIAGEKRVMGGRIHRGRLRTFHAGAE